MIICLICKKDYKNFISLRLHINQTHKMNSKEYYDKFLKRENEGICPECGKETKFISLGKKGYHKFCSYKCRSNSKEVKEKYIQTNLEKYGVEHPFQSEEIKEKKKQTCLEKYGVEHPFQSEEIKEKKKQTSLERYGVEHPSQNKEIKEKSKQTCLEKYGVEHPFQSEEIKEKKKQTSLERYGVENYNQTQEARENHSKRMKNGGAVYALSFNQNPSKPQVELYELVKSLFPEESILNFPAQGKSGKSYSLDIAILSLKIDVEYDGSYWHQDEEKDEERQKDLENLGWKFLRYRDYIPTLEELRDSLNRIKRI